MIPSDRPCAISGLISYRYQGYYGPIMIGAKGNYDALREADRSLTRGKATIEKLEIWNGSKYIPANSDEAYEVLSRYGRS